MTYLAETDPDTALGPLAGQKDSRVRRAHRYRQSLNGAFNPSYLALQHISLNV
jgi:hypothetical protein